MSERGQASVELVGLLPLVGAIALAAFTAVASLSAREQAGAAAAAGAIALLQEGDPRAAARAALPRALRRRAQVAVRGRRVTVTLTPRVPLVARHLRARVAADAGPEPRP